MNRQLLKNFWEKKALTYPIPFEGNHFSYVEKVIKKINSYGVFFTGKEVLDIGCGVGTYTLPISKEAKSVCGIDCSWNMLYILEKLAHIHGIKNISVLNYFWEDVNPQELNLYKRFDIVMAMMTPACKSEEDIVKMEKCSRKWLVYMGWGKRKNPLMERIFLFHGIDWNSYSLALTVCTYLEKLRRRSHFEFFEYNWSFKGTVEEAQKEVCDYIELHGKKPKRDLIMKELLKNSRLGLIEHKTEAEIGLVIWKTPVRED